MAVYKQKDSANWWFKFTWNGKLIRESTKQGNKRVAEQMESARKTGLAKGEVGIRDRKPVPTLAQFATDKFLPFVKSTFAAKVKTLAYYSNGVKCLLAYRKLADETLDAINSEKISGYITHRRAAKLKVSSINRELQVLRRMFALAQEWDESEKSLPNALAKVRMLPGEDHRERVLTSDEERRYLEAAGPLLQDVATVLIDCALRPEECFRLRWENIRDGEIQIQHGKTENARRNVQLSPRVLAILDMRRTKSDTGWVFQAATKSGHVEPSTFKKQHALACTAAKVEQFPLYTFRHTCLTRWAPHMDPWTLARLAGHRDMEITKRYIHPEAETIRAAMKKAREAQGRHSSRHSEEKQGLTDSSESAVMN